MAIWTNLRATVPAGLLAKVTAKAGGEGRTVDDVIVKLLAGWVADGKPKSHKMSRPAEDK